MATLADGHGITFGVGDGASPEVFTNYAKLIDYSESGRSASIIEVRTHDVNYIQKLVDLINNGQVSIVLGFDSSDTAHAAIATNFDAKSLKNYKVVMPDSGAEAVVFSAYIVSMRRVSSPGSVVSLEVGFDVTNTWTIS